MRLRLTLLIALLLLAPGVARATQMAIGTGIAPQTIVSHADVALIANAAAVQILPANLDRVAAVCAVPNGQTSTDTVRIGDATTAAAVGFPMAVGETVTLYVTARRYSGFPPPARRSIAARQ